MKTLQIVSTFLLSIASPALVLGGEPSVTYAKAMPKITPSAKAALIGVLEAAKVPSCSITSTARTAAQQAKAMFDYIVQNGATAAKRMYGSEGDKVVDVYIALAGAPNNQAKVLAEMEKKIVEVLPAARAKLQMMHVDRPEFDVFDVDEASIPSEKRADFIKAAKVATSFHRFLGPDDGEKRCYHFEFPKPK